MRACVVLVAIVASAGAVAGEHVRGRAHVLDGDTIEIAGARVRLHGIDAPEMRQPCRNSTGAAYGCGEQARDALRGMAEGREVTCAVRGRDQYRRTLAVCRVTGGSADIGREMVRAGEAVAYPRGERVYDAEERDARTARRGIWGGTFQHPADFRRDRR